MSKPKTKTKPMTVKGVDENLAEDALAVAKKLRHAIKVRADGKKKTKKHQRKCSGCNKPIQTKVIRQCQQCLVSLKGL